MKKNDAKKSKLTLSKDTVAHLVAKTNVKAGLLIGATAFECKPIRNSNPSECPVCLK